MDKKDALQLFYKKNHICIETASNPEDGNYDMRLANLSRQVDQWLGQIDAADHAMFLTLLSQYTYLTETQCQLRYAKLLSLLQQHLEAPCTLSDVLFVTVESSSPYKSGGDNVRADLQKRNLTRLRKTQIVAAQSNLTAEERGRYPYIVFLDDIIGSGWTLWGEIQRFWESLAPNGNPPALFYACIVPRSHGIRHIEQNCRKQHIPIQGLFDAAWLEAPAFAKGSVEYQRMEPYETMIGNYMVVPQESYFMGFQKNRLLVSFHYNTPNNTLSTFWRVVPGKNFPPFFRDGDQPAKRPTVDDLKAKQTTMRDNAYAYGRSFWRKKQERTEI